MSCCLSYELIKCSIARPMTQLTIPINETKALQDFFVSKVLSSTRQRWHPLYFDIELLSKETIQVRRRV